MLMGEPKVQPRTASHLCIRSVCLLLILSQSIPDLVALLVAPDVIDLGQKEENDGKHVNYEEVEVAPMIERGIIVHIDICRDDAAKLNTHLKERE